MLGVSVMSCCPSSMPCMNENNNNDNGSKKLLTESSQVEIFVSSNSSYPRLPSSMLMVPIYIYSFINYENFPLE